MTQATIKPKAPELTLQLSSGRKLRIAASDLAEVRAMLGVNPGTPQDVPKEPRLRLPNGKATKALAP